ncbi:hypothetical protein TcWFU_005529 [Taenia crassiceps]|uniref:Uncharacterized protein n=1 Tax=Taenia crassiceps TaxID=6207 RepID=A0ABR4Q5J5_9CEST
MMAETDRDRGIPKHYVNLSPIHRLRDTPMTTTPGHLQGGGQDVELEDHVLDQEILLALGTGLPKEDILRRSYTNVYGEKELL